MFIKSKPQTPNHLTEPVPQHFGLASDFNSQSYLTAIKKRKELHDKLITLAAFLTSFGIIAYLFKAEVFNAGSSFMVAAWFALLGSVPIKHWFDQVYARVMPDSVEPRIRAYLDAMAVHDAAVADWNERQLETGRTYWREKRGVAFEKALQEFFVRRGCSVRTTNGSGDGGIDLILGMSGATYWCQCKGHASPIGVAVIREIAGVCS